MPSSLFVTNASPTPQAYRRRAWQRIARPLLRTALAVACAHALQTQAASFSTPQAAGGQRSFSLQASVTPDTEHLGRAIQVFAIALVPQGNGVRPYAKTEKGWVAVSGTDAPALHAQLPAQQLHEVVLLSDDDVRDLAGTQVFLGYGLDGSDGISAFQEMLRQRRFAHLYTFASEPASELWSLRSADDESLRRHFTQALGPEAKTYLGAPWVWMDGVVMTATTSSPVPAPTGLATGTSTTTLQEAGVDEADRIKTNGTHVFSLAYASKQDGRLSLLQRHAYNDGATPGLTAVDALSLPLSKGYGARDLYLDNQGQQLVVLGEPVNYGDIYAQWFAPQYWMQGGTEVILVSAEAGGAMQARRHVRLNATLVGSRRIDRTLYLVLRSYPQLVGLDPWWPTEKTSDNQRLLDALQPSAVLPTISIDAGKAQPLVAARDCYTQPGNVLPSADVITLVAIDLSATTHHHSARCFTGSTEAFYMSDQAVYLATTRSPYILSGTRPMYMRQSSTDLHKFALDGLNMSYRGSGNVPGHLGFDQNRKSFRMGEHNGALRVITQSTQRWGGWVAAVPDTSTDTTPAVAESPGQLSILQERGGSLAVVGELPNARRPAPLGKPGEQLYASRFLGARGYLVTYRLTDPLYVLDLSNPADPFIAGELQVSGYSDYLFPLSETLLLGVGKEAMSDGTDGDGRFAWYQGVKLSLIDLTDPTRPLEADRKVIGRRGTGATVLHDHHGIALLQNGSSAARVALPVSLHDTAPARASGHPSDYYQFTRTELQKFDINLSAKTLQARTPLPAVAPQERSIANDRSILRNDAVHYYQDGVWSSGTW